MRGMSRSLSTSNDGHGTTVPSHVLEHDRSPERCGSHRRKMKIKVLNKLIKATDSKRSSRFHDGDNIFMGWRNFLCLPMAATQWLLIKLFGKRPALPWWPYDAVERIDSLIRPDWRVIEFGAGNSTLWMAKRAESVTSVEDNKEWFNFLSGKIKKDKIQNISVLFRKNDDYFDTSNFPLRNYHLCVVDGSYRSKCIENIMENIVDGGYIYLDNSDQDKDGAMNKDGTNFKTARQVLAQYANENDCSVEYFRGFAPGVLFAQAGMLVEIRR